MNIKSLVVAVGVVAAVMMGGAEFSQAREFGFRGGTSVRIGIGGRSNRSVRYSGPGFYAAPRYSRAYRQSPVASQVRPWYYSRSGAFEYYRPYKPLYRVR